jgi:hypothetical protein
VGSRLTDLRTAVARQLARARQWAEAAVAEQKLAPPGAPRAGSPPSAQPAAGPAPVDGASPAGVSAPAAPDGLSARVTADVATGLWRMRNRMVEPGADRPPPELRALYRHLESTLDTLTNAGVEIQSHDGDVSDPGLALSVVAYQPTTGLDRERVVETIRPTVYLGGKVIQQGEVIVGTPTGEEKTSATSDAEVSQA